MGRFQTGGERHSITSSLRGLQRSANPKVLTTRIFFSGRKDVPIGILKQGSGQ
jgi:hypothetical protein